MSNIRLISQNKTNWVFKVNWRGRGRCFIYSMDELPSLEDTKHIIIVSGKNFTKRLKMTWKKFLTQTCLGEFAVIDWTEFDKTKRK